MYCIFKYFLIFVAYLCIFCRCFDSCTISNFIFLKDVCCKFSNMNFKFQIRSLTKKIIISISNTSAKERNFSLWRRPTWIKCLFDLPPIQCPQDKGMGVKIYSPFAPLLPLSGCQCIKEFKSCFSHSIILVCTSYKHMNTSHLNVAS